MKSSPLIGLVLLAIGVAVGWYSRGIAEKPVTARGVGASAESAQAASATTTAPAADEPESPLRGKRAIRESKVESNQGTDDEKATALAESQMRKMMESMAQRQRARLDQHVERLHGSLSLSPEQRAKVTAWLDERARSVAEMDMATAANPLGSNDESADFSPAGLEVYLGTLLAQDQKSALADFQERDRSAKVDALALKNLSQIQSVVEFTEGQRDQVYRILSEAAGRKLAEEAKGEGGDGMSFMHESVGIEFDPYDLGLDDIMEGAFNKGTEPTAESSEDFEKAFNEVTAKNIREELERRINQKAELLQSVLNEKQLEQYRTELRTRGGGFVEQMIMGLEMSQDESHDTFIIRNVDK